MKISVAGTQNWQVDLIDFPTEKILLARRVAGLKKTSLGDIMRDYVLAGMVRDAKKLKIDIA